jgi:toxin ParE1/3/4
MSRPTIVRPDAEADIRDTHEYLEQVRVGLGGYFLKQLREVLERIESNPEAHGIVWKDVRAVRVRRFQYIVYFVIFPHTVEILAILHGARHESAWQSHAE